MHRSIIVLVVLIAAALPASAQCIDVDGDGYGNPGDPSCLAGSAIDCNDASSTTCPGAGEACDGYDNNCDLQVDEDPSCEPICSSLIQLADPVSVTPEPLPHRRMPTLAWTGSAYGVAWADDREGLGEIYFRLADSFGYPLGTDTRVTQALGVSSEPSLVFTGTEFGVAWYDERDGNPEIYFARLSTSGVKIGPETRVTFDTKESFHPSLVWNGAEYGIAWAEWPYAVVRFQRVSREGQLVGSPVKISSGGADRPSLAATDTGYAVVWSANGEGNMEVYFQRLDSAGAKIGGNIRITTEPDDSSKPALVWTGSEFGITWWDQRFGSESILFTRLDAQGSRLMDDVRISDGAQHDFGPSVAWSGGEYAVLIAHWAQVSLQRVSSAGELIDVETDLGHCDAWGWDIAWTGAQYGIVYVVDASTKIMLTRAGCECGPDLDGDEFRTCQGDCNDADDTVWPGAPESCDSRDNDCDSSTDEDANGEDADGDGVHGACDNCALLYNADQRNEDGDALGNACDNCLFVLNDDQQDTDTDGRGDACDNCPESYNPLQDDLDHDRVGDACDNCISTRNESQHDLNADGEGDECDLDDGVVYFRQVGRPRVRWQGDPDYSSYNFYRGSLAVLRATGEYTQESGSNPYAGRFCGLTVTYQDDSLVPSTGEAFYWLVTGVGVGGEEPLGDGTGVARPNTHPCP